jgi:hypothetical protein
VIKTRWRKFPWVAAPFSPAGGLGENPVVNMVTKDEDDLISNHKIDELKKNEPALPSVATGWLSSTKLWEHRVYRQKRRALKLFNVRIKK